MQSITKAERYWLCQVKWNNPPRNCTAELRDGARKNTKLRQKILKVRIRCAQTEMKPPGQRGKGASADFVFAGKRRRSTDKTTPWMPPNTTYVQFAPCQSPPRSMVVRRLRLVFHCPPWLPPKGIYR